MDAAGPPTANVLLLSGSHAPRPVVVMSFTSPTTPDVWTEKTAVFLLRAPGPLWERSRCSVRIGVVYNLTPTSKLIS